MSRAEDAAQYWAARHAEELARGDETINVEEWEGMDNRQRAQIAERPFLRRAVPTRNPMTPNPGLRTGVRPYHH